MKALSKHQSRNLSPWSGFRDDLWDLFDRFSRDVEMPSLLSDEQFSPKIEFKDAGNSYLISAEVPGMDENDINVTLKDNQLVIEGEKKNETKSEDKKSGTYHSEFSYGRFYRAIPFSEDVDPDKVTASYKNGLLTIELAKVPEKASKNRKIQITNGKGSQTENKH